MSLSYREALLVALSYYPAELIASSVHVWKTFHQPSRKGLAAALVSAFLKGALALTVTLTAPLSAFWVIWRDDRDQREIARRLVELRSRQ